MTREHVLLLVAIACEVAATLCLKASHGMTRLWPGVGAVVGYLAAVLLLAFALNGLPVGLVYAAWAGLGTAGAVAVGTWVFGERLPAGGWVGVGLVIAGVVLLGVYAPPEADDEPAAVRGEE